MMAEGMPSAPLATPEIAFVIPCYNEEDNVRQIYAAVSREAERHARSHEILFIDNASTDRTRDLIRGICAEDDRVRAIFNRRNFGQMRSPVYAVYQVEGEAAICLGADFQDPPALIGALIAQWRAGAQVVLGQRRSEPGSAILRACRHLGYGLLGRFADYPVIPGATGFGLYGRDCLDTLAAWNEPEPFFRGMVIEAGFRIAVIPFDRPARAAGQSKNNFRTLLDFALSGVAGSAKALLRVPMMLSVYAGIGAFALLLATCVSFALGLHTPGLMLGLLSVQGGMFAVLLLFLGLIGEQVRVISERTRHVPLVLEEERVNFPAGRERPSPRTIVQPTCLGRLRS